MTHIIIGQNTKEVNQYLYSLLSKILNKEISDTFIQTSPDIHILRSQNINSIGIEDVKGFQKEMVYKPFIESHQIGIVFNAEKLTTEAQNSFLKTLEEQGDTTIYILISNNQRSLLDTILSRGVKHILNGQKDTEERDEELTDDLVSMFKKFEELAELGVDEILLFLERIQKKEQIILRKKIAKGENSEISLRRLQVINTAYERIRANGNKRLVLENMIVSLRD